MFEVAAPLAATLFENAATAAFTPTAKAVPTWFDTSTWFETFTGFEMLTFRLMGAAAVSAPAVTARRPFSSSWTGSARAAAVPRPRPAKAVAIRSIRIGPDSFGWQAGRYGLPPMVPITVAPAMPLAVTPLEPTPVA